MNLVWKQSAFATSFLSPPTERRRRRRRRPRRGRRRRRHCDKDILIEILELVEK